MIINASSVEKLEGTEYKFPVTVEPENGAKEVSSSNTNYSITVIDNIKEKLKKNTAIPIQKLGGISENIDMYKLYVSKIFSHMQKIFCIWLFFE
ncbi:hypothetical protein NST17_06180 [Caldifermentibacillus hisashii]|uniref:Uncharacterized protein n=1 Tax=Caldifermentibacillus hisashii TaxID=996558 RepID=A0ABU9JVA9_9BACI